MRTAFAWISILLVTLVLGGCSREPKRTETLSTSGEALSTVMTRTYGFESLTDWFPYSSSPTLALSNTHTEGLKSLAVSGGGWSSVISRALSKEGRTRRRGIRPSNPGTTAEPELVRNHRALRRYP
jgi:uncharacterized protein YceK